MRQADIFAPLDFAHLIAPQSIWDRTLFEHLMSRFDFILQLTEDVAGTWTVWIWHTPGSHLPGELGIQGQPGRLGWIHDPVGFSDAVDMTANAAAILKQRDVRHVVVFSPGADWLVRVRSRLASTAFLFGDGA